MSYLKDFRERISMNDYPGFLKIWEEYCYCDTPDGEELKQILQEVKGTEVMKPFGNHVSRALSLWREVKDVTLRSEILKLILDVQTVNSEELADISIEFLKEKYPEDPLFDEKLRLVGLRTRENFQGAISKFDLLSHIAKGKFVFHTGGWGTGEIIDVSQVREEIALEFDFVLEQKNLSFSNALKTLLPLPDDHFLSKRFGSPDLLEKEARESPVEVVRGLLKDLGPKTASEIREELYELVIPAAEWAKWWQNVRSKLKKDTKIYFPEDSKDPFRILSQEISHEEALYKSLETQLSMYQMIQLVYSYFRDYPEILRNVELKNSLQKKFLDMLSLPELSPPHRIQVLFLLEDLDTENISSQEMLQKEDKILSLISAIEILAFKKRVLAVIQKARKDWEPIFLSLLLEVHPNLLRDYILGELLHKGKKEDLKNKLQVLLDNPDTYPLTYIWYFQKILDEKKEILFFGDIPGRIKFFEGFLVLLDHLYLKPDYRDTVKKMVQILTENRFALVREMMKDGSLEEVKEFLLLSTKCSVLNDHEVKIIQSLAEVAHPPLLKDKKKPSSVEVDDVVWTTREGYEKAKKQIEHLATVEVVLNSREIEEARSHGDLRENAEYKAALEKRDRLQSELQYLSDLFNNARILTSEDVSMDQVGVGSVVTCKNKKGKTVVYTFLGPWEAEIEKNILSFQAKLAQSIKGFKVGDTFTFHDEEFTIMELSSYFLK
ncbi:MAG: GreA/GreB family elongation factor [Chlamydiota bacterium]